MTRNANLSVVPTPARKAAIYTRISMDKTGEGSGVDRQQTACEALANSRGWTVDEEHVFVENDTSASKGRRPVFDRMIEAAKRGEFDIIVAWHVDRLTRKLTELEDLIEMAEKTGTLFTTVSGDLDLTTDSGRLVGRILASVARGEVERKGARQKAANNQRAEQGKQPHTGRAYGYANDGSVIEAEALFVREAFRALLLGSGTQYIARELNAAGSRNVRGREWQRWTIRDMLLNPRYIAERHILRPGPNGDRVRTYVGPGDWEPLLDEATFRAAGTILHSATRMSAGSSGNVRCYIGTGLYVCGVCGGKMKTHYGGTKLADGSVRRERKYACSNDWHLMRQADHIDEYVLRVVAGRLNDPQISQTAAKTGGTAINVRNLRVRLAELEARSDSMAIKYAQGLLNDRQLRAANVELNALIDSTTRELAAIGKSSALASVLTGDTPGQDFLAASPQRQASIIGTLAVVTVHKGVVGRRRPRNTNDREKMTEWARLLAETIDIDWL